MLLKILGDNILEKLKINIKYHWIDLNNKIGELYKYPQTRREVDKKHLDHSGIYRWIKVNKSDEILCLYIGESVNLYNRLYGYLRKSESKETSYRIGRELKKILGNDIDSEIRFQVLKLSNAKLFDKNITDDSVRSIHFRQTLEQALIYYHKSNGECQLNR